jgi:hypothetical protein
MMSWLQWTTLVMQVWILFMVAGSSWYAFQTKKNIGKALQAFYEYRREIAWMTARIEALEQRAMGQGNVRAEASRGK